ncbi:MAG: TonB-dependent receptor, partial [Flavobacterium sp.]
MKFNINKSSLSFSRLSSIRLLSLCLLSQFTFAQKKDENIGTEVVNVVKPYSPSISDAFKVKEAPTLDDEVTSQKEKIEYTIFSFPVASTFVPSKGKAANVEKPAAEKFFSNYALLGLGNYGTVNAELYVTESVSDTDYFGAMLRHVSSQGGIKDVVLDDYFYHTGLDLTYGSRNRNLSWNADLGYKNQVYNWYGIHPEIANAIDLSIVDEKQTYNTFYAGGKIEMEEGVFEEASLQYNRFWDVFGSAENHFAVKPSIGFDVNDKKVQCNFIFDYIDGSFDQHYFGGAAYKYGFTNLGFEPGMKIQKEDLNLNLGLGFYYSTAPEAGESEFYFYPQ